MALAVIGEISAGQQRAEDVTPKVSAQFQPEVARLVTEGLRLKEAVEADLGEGVRCLAAVFESQKPKAPNQAFEFRLIESDGQAAKTIFRRPEFFFSFTAAGELSRLNGTDINGDGLKEFIFKSSSGGNCWSCNPVEIYQVKDHKGALIAAGPIQSIEDLNNDRAAELLVADARWAVYNDLPNAAAPSATIVYAWQNGRYVYASRDFPAYYKGEIERLRAAIDEAKAEITTDDFSDETYIGRAISLTLTFAHAGEPERGLKELETLMGANVRTAEQAKRRRMIMEDFRNGDSARKLREMKPGDPML